MSFHKQQIQQFVFSASKVMTVSCHGDVIIISAIIIIISIIMPVIDLHWTARFYELCCKVEGVGV